MPDPLQLFISYRSSDAAKVDKIAHDLALLRHEDGTHPYRPWQDKHNLPPAHPHWWDAILDAIDASDVFVFHLSAESLKSKVCQAELEYAHKCNLPTIPIVLEGEFFLIPASGKYDLPKEAWALMPEWLRESQMLWYIGADFFQKFEMAMDVFRKAWPRRRPALRPLNPDTGDPGSNHARYAQAVDYAERLAFTEAEKLFDALVRRNDRQYGAIAADWLEILRLYTELIEVAEQPRTRFQFKSLWLEYVALFPKEFWEGVFDPKELGEGNRHDKIAMPSHLLALDPTQSRAEQHFKRGNIFYNARDYIRALADYDAAIAFDPQYAAVYVKRGKCHQAMGDPSRAIIEYDRAISIDPLCEDAYFERGNSYSLKSEYQSAINDYDRAIQINPLNVSTYNKRGEVYNQLSDYDLAIADYTMAIDLDHQYVAAYVNRGGSYYSKRDYKQAMSNYNEAILLDAQNSNALHMRAYTCLQLGDYDLALSDATTLLWIDPENQAMLDVRTEALYKKQELGK